MCDVRQHVALVWPIAGKIHILYSLIPLITKPHVEKGTYMAHKSQDTRIEVQVQESVLPRIWFDTEGQCSKGKSSISPVFEYRLFG